MASGLTAIVEALRGEATAEAVRAYYAEHLKRFWLRIAVLVVGAVAHGFLFAWWSAAVVLAAVGAAELVERRFGRAVAAMDLKAADPRALRRRALIQAGAYGAAACLAIVLVWVKPVEGATLVAIVVALVFALDAGFQLRSIRAAACLKIALYGLTIVVLFTVDAVVHGPSVETGLEAVAIGILTACIGTFALDMRDRRAFERRAMDELRAQERERARLALVAQHARDAVAIYDAEGRYVWVNPAYEAQMGRGAHELIGGTWHPFLADGQRHLLKRLRGAVVARRPIRLVVRLLRRGGEAFWCDASITPVFDEEGHLIHWVSVERDISEAKAREAELERQGVELRRLALAAEHACDAIVVTDPDWRIEWVNARFVAVTGLALEDVRGALPADVVVPPDPDEAMARHFSEAVAAQRSARGELQLLRRGGAAVWHDVSLMPVFDDGALIHWVCVEHDISELKAREAELERALAELTVREHAVRRFTLVAEHTSDSIVITGPDDAIEWVNDSFTARTGWTLSDVADRPRRLMADPSNDPATLDALHGAIEARRPFRGQLRVWCRGDRWVWYDIALTPLFGEDGRFEAYISIERDISELKAREAELERKEAELTRLALVAEHATDSIVVADQDGRIEWANAAFFAQTGLSAAEVSQVVLRDMVAPGTDVATLRGVGEAVAAGRPVRAQLQLMRRGRPVWHDALLTPLPDEDGVARRYITVERDISELKAREAELARQQRETRRLTLAAEHATDAIVITDPHHRIEWVNGGFTEHTGWTLEDVAGRLRSEHVAPDACPEAHARIRRAMREGRAIREQLQLIRRGGRSVWHEIGLTPVRDADGAIESWISVEHDISALKAREAELMEVQAATRRLAMATEHATDSVAIMGPDLKIEWANAAFSARCGLPLDALVGRSRSGFQLPDPHPDADAVARLRTAVAEGRPAREQFRLPGPDGTPIWHDVIVSPARDADGRIVNWIGVERDISELKARAAELAEKERELARLALVAEHALDSVVIYDPEGRIEWVNRSFTALTGYAAEEVVGRAAGLMVCDEPADQAELTRVRNAFAERRAERTTVRIKAKDGRVFWCDADFSPVRAPDGRLKCWISVERDVTEVKRREAELAEARAVAEAAAETKSRFLATMSHEIRTPMNGILGTADLLADSGLDVEQERLVRTITRSSEALLRIINDVLDLSKLEADRVEIDPEPFDPVELCEVCAQLLRPLAEGKGLDMRLEVEPDAPRALLGDHGRIQQIVLNLLGNAVKFTEAGAVTVTLATEPESGPECEPGARRLTIAVADTGIGIAPDRLAAVFEDFSQADGTITRRFGGTGLGLSISRRLAQAMGGDLSAASTPGEGSVFSLALSLPPAGDAPEAAPGVASGAASGGISGLNAPAPATATAIASPAGACAGDLERVILLVDDNATNRFVAERMLSGCGARVITAADGAEAVRAVDEHHPDLVLMDVSMPVMDGLEATRRIRAMEDDAPPRPVILLTAHASEDQRAAGAEAGATGFLSKPVRKADLHAAVRGALPPAPAGLGADPAIA